jgi:hypothetical protein
MRGLFEFCDLSLTLTKMAISEKEQMGALHLGLNNVLYITNRCRIYEIL